MNLLRLRPTILILIASIAVADTGCRAISRIGDSRQTIAARRLSRQGLQAMHEGDWNVAENLFSDALQVSGSDDRAHRGLAESLWQRDERDLAIRHMEQAVRLSAADPKLVQRLGRMYLEVGRIKEADQQSTAALESARDSPDVWALRGDCLNSQGHYDDALAAYHRALALQPDFPLVQLQAAEIYRIQGRYDRLLATVDRLQDSLGGIEIPARADMLRGIAMRQLGQHQAARRCFARAATKSPTDADPHLQIASLCLDQGDVQSARDSVAVAMQLDPGAVHEAGWVDELESHPQRLSKLNFPNEVASQTPIELQPIKR